MFNRVVISWPEDLNLADAGAASGHQQEKLRARTNDDS
jgi:hypothetical protein